MPRTVFPYRSHSSLKRIRLGLGISQDELSWRVGIAQSRLSRAERGYLQLTPKEVASLATVLKVEVKDIDAE